LLPVRIDVRWECLFRQPLEFLSSLRCAAQRQSPLGEILDQPLRLYRLRRWVLCLRQALRRGHRSCLCNYVRLGRFCDRGDAAGAC